MAAWLYRVNLLFGLVVKAWSSRAADPGSIPAGGVGILFVCSFGFVFVCGGFFFFFWGGGGVMGVESHQCLKNWHSSGYPARRLAL